ncbi:hypothetical protein JCGZ_09117 [Jatropha curcas]|uniref:Uncharacterized protein n=1 Tax=Jatropha curcas TaxID=180498 RepID=A0A067KV20_JATCU|nr:hypothetical protein JCGZ_09117 [Jatropha curcas]
MLAGFSKPSAGQILCNGHDVTESGVFHQYKHQHFSALFGPPSSTISRSSFSSILVAEPVTTDYVSSVANNPYTNISVLFLVCVSGCLATGEAMMIHPYANISAVFLVRVSGCLAIAEAMMINSVAEPVTTDCVSYVANSPYTNISAVFLVRVSGCLATAEAMMIYSVSLKRQLNFLARQPFVVAALVLWCFCPVRFEGIPDLSHLFQQISLFLERQMVSVWLTQSSLIGSGAGDY